jgi:hypothetical protein
MNMWRSLSIAGLGVTLLSLNAAAQPAPPPPMTQSGPANRASADGYGQADMSCRRSAADRTGYRASGQGSGSQAEQRYASAYYACMNDQDGAPPPGDAYAYGSPSPDDYAYGSPPPGAYGAPAPYYPYAPYPSPYPYYPPYYGPGYYGPDVTLGFGFGGGHGGGRHR